jgi:hypothetical protein
MKRRATASPKRDAIVRALAKGLPMDEICVLVDTNPDYVREVRKKCRENTDDDDLGGPHCSRSWYEANDRRFKSRMLEIVSNGDW